MGKQKCLQGRALRRFEQELAEYRAAEASAAARRAKEEKIDQDVLDQRQADEILEELADEFADSAYRAAMNNPWRW